MKKWTRAIFAIIVAASIAFSGIPVFAEEVSGKLGLSGVTPFGIIDVTPPVLTSIALDKTEVTAPGTNTVTAIVTDDISGVDYVSVEFIGASTGRYLSISLSNEIYNEQTEEWEHIEEFIGNLKIDQYTFRDDYICSYIYISDKAGNVQRYSVELEEWQVQDGYLPIDNSVSFTVSNSAVIDTTSPQLTDISISNNAITAPGELIVTARASDDLSDIEYISVEFFNAETNQYASTGLSSERYNESMDEWEQLDYFEGTINIDKYKLPGTFQLSYIYVCDKAGNVQRYANDLSEWQIEDGYLPLPSTLSFVVVNDGQLDTSPPRLTSVSLSKTTVDTPGTIEITAMADDDISGADYISIEFYNADNDKYISAELINEVFNEDTNEWERTEEFRGRLDISLYQLPGLYEPSYAYVSDNAGNVQRYANELSEWQSEDGFLTFPFGIPSITVINDNNGNPITQPVNPSSSSSSNSGGSSGTTHNTPNATPQPVTANQAINAYSTAYAAAKHDGSDNVTVRLINASSIPQEAIKAINRKAAKDRISVTIHADTVDNFTLLNRLTFDPAKTTKDINVTASYSNPEAVNLEAKLKRYFDNKFTVIALGQKEPFGVPVRISSKIDLSGMDMKNLCLYSYDSKANQYKRIENSNYTMSSTGYLNFTIEQAGDIIISDGELRWKGKK